MNNKLKVLIGVFLVLFLVIEARLFWLQNTPNRYKQEAILNALTKEYITPPRGFIYDRKGRLLVSNQPVYSVWFTPAKSRAFDTLQVARLLDLDTALLRKRIRKAYRYSRVKPSMIASGYLKNDIASFKTLLFKFPGFEIRENQIRKYHTKHAANVLGYLQEVDEKLLKKDPYYRQGDWAGVTGLEKYYEKILRGKKGVKYYERDKLNRIIKSYKDGLWDTLPQPGKDIQIGLDIELQAFIDTLMQGKHGAVVAIEPETGEILALVTAPSYDPELMTRRDRNKYIARWLKDKVHQPLFDRALIGAYPPGSPFKLLNALVGLQTGAITSATHYVCHHGFKYGNRYMRCHCGANGPVYLDYAIPYSCNTFFSKTYLNIIDRGGTPPHGVNQWASMVKSFGLGDFLGYDLPIGRRGNIPDSAYYRRFFGHNRWRSMNIISNGIGQGQILVTPIQLANMTAAIANRGYYYTPHLAIRIQDTTIDARFKQKHRTAIDSIYFERVIRGMHEVYTKGTARYSQIPGLEICGKTGTAENFILKDGEKIKMPDHSIFVAFAPKDHPKIAVSVFIENGGYGASLAAPIASLVIDKYLNDTISRPDLYRRVTETDLYPVYEMKNTDTHHGQ